MGGILSVLGRVGQDREVPAVVVVEKDRRWSDGLGIVRRESRRLMCRVLEGCPSMLFGVVAAVVAEEGRYLVVGVCGLMVCGFGGRVGLRRRGRGGVFGWGWLGRRIEVRYGRGCPGLLGGRLGLGCQWGNGERIEDGDVTLRSWTVVSLRIFLCWTL